jgi:hypothetical protein
MAVPLIRPWLRGNDGGWDRYTICCTQLNPGRLGSVTGLLDDRSAVVAPGGGSGVDGSLAGTGTSTVVYGVSGRSYRLIRYRSSVSRMQLADPAAFSWQVSSDVYSWSCLQRGTSRNPAADCGTGTHQYTRGQLGVPAPGNPLAYSVRVPISYRARVVDSLGRPLAVPYTSSAGHWLLRAQAQFHGWLWTVEWSVGRVAAARVAGSSFVSGDRIVLTDGPFN